MDLNNLNGIVEDLGACIGYTATAKLIDWFGGGVLHVPREAKEDHPICKIIGLPAYRLLVKDWGGDKVWLPLGYYRESNRRDRMIAVLIELGIGTDTVGKIAGMSRRHVQDIRKRLEDMGVLPMILRKAGLERRVENSGQMPGREVKAAAEPPLNDPFNRRGKKGKRR